MSVMDKYEQAMRILRFGDSECTTDDPVERLDGLRRPPQPLRVDVVDLRGVPDEMLTQDQLRWRRMSRGENTGDGVGNQKF